MSYILHTKVRRESLRCVQQTFQSGQGPWDILKTRISEIHFPALVNTGTLVKTVILKTRTSEVRFPAIQALIFVTVLVTLQNLLILSPKSKAAWK